MRQPTRGKPFSAFHTIFRSVAPKISRLKYFLFLTQSFLAEKQGNNNRLWHKIEIKLFINYYYSALQIE